MTVDHEKETPWSPASGGHFVVVVIVALILVTVVAFTVMTWSFSWPTPFNSTVWKEAADGNPVRIEMIDDLLDRHDLVGMPRDEIDSLLGVPPATDYFSEYEYVYWLGPERGWMGIDSEWLCLKFEGDVVTDADVLRD